MKILTQDNQLPTENKMYNMLLEFTDYAGQREYIIENVIESHIEEYDFYNEIEIMTKLGEYFKLPFTRGKISKREIGTAKIEIKEFE